ncbi:class I SAM-dependent methyltransferase [Spirosoma endbachense]|uniref:Methyltransferase domain-containing protein n=1 Tax=Spirosoma endbachense TaxID=2666025 RepID=A0A6P1VTC0_9BACT|nr:class I SAM-dependent methyltransferase [Spirosoma endbachense]QHV96481.1 methyltransferase domain-containing protein [Spirosoma endbachense]
MNSVLGIKGYDDVAQKFIEATITIGFTELHQDFLPFIPEVPGYILDLGAGIGRDAFEFSKRGHSVIAVEPTEEFRIAGEKLYHSPAVKWIDDCLPKLSILGHPAMQFDFILASAVWHHLDEAEQTMAMERIASLLRTKGIFALSLRHGPPGVGCHVFPTSSKLAIQDAKHLNLTTLVCIENQPSLMANKENVSWTRLVFQKQKR